MLWEELKSEIENNISESTENRETLLTLLSSDIDEISDYKDLNNRLTESNKKYDDIKVRLEEVRKTNRELLNSIKISDSKNDTKDKEIKVTTLDDIIRKELES